jgi:Tfp pilus assembly protein PilX
MKRLLVLILVLTLLVITGTFVSADAQARFTNNEFNLDNCIELTEAK